MAQIARLKSAEIQDGNDIVAGDLNAEFNQLVTESNSQDTRLDALESSSVDLSGNNTFTGTNIFSHASTPIKTDKILENTAATGVTIDSVVLKDGMVTVSGDPASNGTLGYTSNLAKFYANGTAYWLPLLPTPSGNGGKFAKVNSGGTGWEYGTGVSYACLVDSKSTGTDGGTFTSGAWRTRDLNTEQSDVDGIVSLAANRFTLGAGSYVIKAYCPASQVNGHKAQLYNVTYAGAVSLNGCQAALCDNASVTATNAIVAGRFTITGTEQFEIQHQCVTTKATTGFGKAAGFSTAEIYTVVELWKVA